MLVLNSKLKKFKNSKSPFWVRFTLVAFLVNNTVACFDKSGNSTPRAAGEIQTQAKNHMDVPAPTIPKANQGIKICTGNNCTTRKETCLMNGNPVNDTTDPLGNTNVNSRADLPMAKINELFAKNPGQTPQQASAAGDTLVASLGDILSKAQPDALTVNKTKAAQINSMRVDYTSTPGKVKVSVRLNSAAATAAAVADPATAPAPAAKPSTTKSTAAAAGTAAKTDSSADDKKQTITLDGDLTDKSDDFIKLNSPNSKVTGKLVCADETVPDQLQDCQTTVVSIDWTDSTPAAKTLTVFRLNTVPNGSAVSMTWPTDVVGNASMTKLGKFFSDSNTAYTGINIRSSETVFGNSSMLMVFVGPNNQTLGWKFYLIDLDQIPGDSGANMQVKLLQEPKDLNLTSLVHGNTPNLDLVNSLSEVDLVYNNGKGVLLFDLVLSSLQNNKNDYVELQVDRSLNPVSEADFVAQKIGLTVP